RRICRVNNSTFANDTLMSPAITSPLSRIRSRTSTRPGGRAVIRVDRSLDTFALHYQGAALLKKLRWPPPSYDSPAEQYALLLNQAPDRTEIEIEIFSF